LDHIAGNKKKKRKKGEATVMALKNKAKERDAREKTPPGRKTDLEIQLGKCVERTGGGSPK